MAEERAQTSGRKGAELWQLHSFPVYRGAISFCVSNLSLSLCLQEILLFVGSQQHVLYEKYDSVEFITFTLG